MVYAKKVAREKFEELWNMLNEARLNKKIKDGFLNEYENDMKIREIGEEELQKKIEEFLNINSLYVVGDIYQIADDLELRGLKKKANELREIGGIVKKQKSMPVISVYPEMLEEFASYADFVKDDESQDSGIISKRNLLKIVNPFESEDLLNENIYIDIMSILKEYPFADYYLFQQ